MAALEIEDILTAGTVLSVTFVVLILVLLIVTIVYVCYLTVGVSYVNENLANENIPEIDPKIDGYQINSDGTIAIKGLLFNKNIKVFLTNNTTFESYYVTDLTITDDSVSFKYNKINDDDKSIDLVLQNGDKIIKTIKVIL